MAQNFLKAVALNTAPLYQLTAKRDDGSIIDLTNCTVKIRWFKGTVQTNATTGHDATAITSATGGVFTWQPKTGDLPAGKYKLKGDVDIFYSDGSDEVLYNNALMTVRNRL